MKTTKICKPNAHKFVVVGKVYDSDDDGHRHQKVICNKCGKVKDVKLEWCGYTRPYVFD